MCAPSPPPAPDYIGAAKQQGESNLEATRAGAKLSNPNIISPYGTQTVTYGSGFDEAGYNTAMKQYQDAMRNWSLNPAPIWQVPGANQWSRGFSQAFSPMPTPPDIKQFQKGDQDRPTITQKFSPEQQAIYEQQTRVKKLLGGLGEQGAQSLKGIVGKPLDFSGTPAMPGTAEDTRDKVINAMMSRVNEDTDVAKDRANSELIAAGIRPGSKAYDNNMRMIDRAYNDARNQAFLASGQEAQRDFALDSERRRQAITELLSQRQIPLNEITALMSGSQVQNPFAMPGYSGVQAPGAAPYFAAQNALGGYNTDVFNAGAAGAGNLQAGLFGLGSSALMAGALSGVGAGAAGGGAAAAGLTGLGMA
jgi:hypothetical protein